jgi:uncharacterized SAM-binding protein YcdF (DUF218 family)
VLENFKDGWNPLRSDSQTWRDVKHVLRFLAQIVKNRGMFFVLSKILAFLVEPLVHPYLLLGAALLARLVRRRRLMRGLIFTAVALPLAYGVLPISLWPLRHLENIYDVVNITDPSLDQIPIDGVIVLGGHTGSGVISESRNQPQQSSAADRLTKGMMIHQAHPGSIIIFSGFSGKLKHTGWSEGEIIKRLIAEMNVGARKDGSESSQDIIYETTSRNTYENAVYSLEMAVPQPGSRWILVTSAWHMPRAMGAFRAAGWPEITPYPTDYQTAVFNDKFFNLKEGTNAARLWLKEYAGFIAYWITGRSDRLIP